MGVSIAGGQHLVVTADIHRQAGRQNRSNLEGPLVPATRVEKNLSSHTKTALWPMVISRYGHFITVQVENCYGTARVIPYVVLYRGYGTGSVKNSSVCFKNHKCFAGRALKKMPEWHLQKIDLNELKNIRQMGVRYQTPEAGLEPDEDKDMKMARTNENRVLIIEDEQDIFRRQYLRLKHYEDGNLINVVMGTYRVAEGERNVMVVKDTMCLRRATKKDEIAEKKMEEISDMSALFECRKCGKKFEVLSSLAIHRQECDEAAEQEVAEEIVKGDEEIKCVLCGKMYNALKGARIHKEMECDRGMLTNMCIYCGKLFCVPAVCDWHVENDCKLAEERRQKEKKEKEREKEEEKIKVALKAAKQAQEEAEKKVKEQKEAEKKREEEEAEQKERERIEKAKQVVIKAAKQAQEEAEKKAKEAEKKAQEEAEKKAQEEAEKKAKEAEKKAQEEAEKKAQEEAEKKAKEAEKKAQEEAEKIAQEEAEKKAKEAEKKAQEEAEKKAQEEAEKKMKEEEKKKEDSTEMESEGEKEELRGKIDELIKKIV